MTTKARVTAALDEIGIIPAIRVSSVDDALFAAEVVAAAGIPIVEVTMTIPNAAEVIATLTAKNARIIVGAGTVLDTDVAKLSLDAGASFITSPGLDVKMVEYVTNRNVAVLPGAMTPTEVMMAVRAGADFVKIFPSAQAGGPSYIKALKSPFPAVRLIASGGVNQKTAGEFILAGAAALGIGQDLIQPRAIRQRDANWIHELAHRFLKIVSDARRQRAELNAN